MNPAGGNRRCEPSNTMQGEMAMELSIYPDKVLRARCTPVKEVDNACLRKAEQMLRFMYDVKGVGLAGPQVSWTKRIVALDATPERAGGCVLVNPRIISSQGESVEEEGCLSLPGIYAQVARAEKVVVAAYTLDGERVEMEAEGLESRVWQHEIDHLNGMLFVDRLLPSALMAIERELRELERSRSHGAGDA